jgi:hypothetical protein
MPANALNISAAGIVKFDGTAYFSADTVTNHNVIVGGASNALTSVPPSATVGIPLVSQGAGADPSFAAASVAGGGTGATTLTGVLIGNGTSPITASPVTQHDVIVGGVSNALTSVAPSATVGVPLISQGAAADPIFGTVSVAGGGTGAATLTGVVIGNGTSAFTASPVTQHDVLLGGASNAITSLSPSTAGFVLTSNGVGADPTFQAAGSNLTITGDSGGALSPTAGNWNILGGANGPNIVTTGAASTLTIRGDILTYVQPGAYPYTVLSTDYYIAVDSSVARTINLPNAPTSHKSYVIKDRVGSAGTNNITVTTPGGAVTIDGATTFTINSNFGSINVIFNGTSYEVF